MSSKDVLYAFAEDRQERSGERSFELEDRINHRTLEEDPEDILDLLREFGF